MDAVCSADKTVLSVAKVIFFAEKKKNHIRPIQPIKVSALQGKFSFCCVFPFDLPYHGVDFLIYLRRPCYFVGRLSLKRIRHADDAAELITLKTGAAGHTIDRRCRRRGGTAADSISAGAQ